MDVGTPVVIRNVDREDEPTLEGCRGRVVSTEPLDLDSKTNGPFRGWLHRVELDDKKHPAQVSGYMASRLWYYPFHLGVVSAVDQLAEVADGEEETD